MVNYYQILIRNLSRQAGPALSFGGPPPLSYSYQDLHKAVGHFRSLIQGASLKADCAVIVGIPLSLETFAAFLALLAEGHTAVFLPPKARRKAWQQVKTMGFKPQLLLAHKPHWFKRLLFKGLGIPFLYPSPLSAQGPYQAAVNPHPAPALLSFSSGSTGHPKAILRSHALLIEQHRAIKLVYPSVSEQVDLPLFPNLMLHNLATGAHSVLPKHMERSLEQLDPHQVLAQIKAQGVNTLTGNVYYYEKLLEAAQAQNTRLPQVKALGVGGSPVSERLLARLADLFPQAERHVIYGATEAEPIAHRLYQAPSDPLNGFAVGALHPWLEMRWTDLQTIHDAQGQKVQSGALQVRGPQVAGAATGWLDTGDYGYHKAGQVYLTARAGNARALGHRQHYQLEHYLLGQAGIKGAAAVAGDRRFSVFYTGSASVKAVEKALSGILDLSYIHKIKRLPKLPYDDRHRSKILYRKLSV